MNFEKFQDKWSDFTFVDELGNEFKAHKIVLATKSKYFESLFETHVGSDESKNICHVSSLKVIKPILSEFYDGRDVMDKEFKKLDLDERIEMFHYIQEWIIEIKFSSEILLNIENYLKADKEFLNKFCEFIDFEKNFSDIPVFEYFAKTVIDVLGDIPLCLTQTSVFQKFTIRERIACAVKYSQPELIIPIFAHFGDGLTYIRKFFLTLVDLKWETGDFVFDRKTFGEMRTYPDQMFCAYFRRGAIDKFHDIFVIRRVIPFHVEIFSKIGDVSSLTDESYTNGWFLLNNTHRKQMKIGSRFRTIESETVYTVKKILLHYNEEELTETLPGFKHLICTEEKISPPRDSDIVLIRDINIPKP